MLPGPNLIIECLLFVCRAFIDWIRPPRRPRWSGLPRTLAIRLAPRSPGRPGRFNFDGSGFSGTVTLENERVMGEIRLGLMMRPLKGVITREIEAGLDYYLAD